MQRIEEQARIEDGFNSLVDVFRQQAACAPDQIGFTFLEDGEEQELHRTYADLDREARAIAGRLQALGAEGRRALLMYDPGLDYIAAFAGCLYANVTAVPLYPPDPLRAQRTFPRLQAVVQDCQADLILTTNSILEWADTLFSRLVGVETILPTDEITSPDSAAIVAELAGSWRAPKLDRSALAFLQYTSGSTGDPKGVMVSHGNLLANLWQFKQTVDRPDACVVTWLPAYHDMGLIGGILECWYSGRRNVQLSPLKFFQRPYRWLRAISHNRATTSASPNFGFDLCVRKITEEERKSLDLSSWRIAMNGAEPIRPETLETFVEAFASCGVRRSLFYPCYGLAEATLMVSGGQQEAGPIVQSWEGDRRIVGCGQSVPGQKLLVVDPDTFAPLEVGRVGEIWVKGPNVAQGYWRRPELSEQIFRAKTADGEGPFLRTGDMGFVDERGELFITGRLKDLIIVFGRNHYPQDIEQTVEGCHAALKQYGGAAFSIESGGQERLVIVHELMRPQRVDVPGVIDTIRQRVLQEHQIPVEAIVLIKPGTISKTSSGKIQRRACREMYLDGRLQVVAQWQAERGSSLEAGETTQYVAPRTAMEELIAEMWAEVLGLPRVGVHDGFFDLGGNSLLASQLASRLSPYFQEEIPLDRLFERPTVAALAELLEQNLASRDGGDELAATIRELDAMTDEEAQQMLDESAQASQAAEASSLAKAPAFLGDALGVSATVENYEYLIIGAGPGGLQLGYYLERAGRSYKILEAGSSAGTFLKRFPRRRRLLSINKIAAGGEDPEVSLRWDWNSLLSIERDPLFQQFSDEYLPPADKLVDYLEEFSRRFDLNVQYDSRVVRIDRAGAAQDVSPIYEAVDERGGRYRAKVLVVATGCQLSYLPDVPGIELAEDYSTASLDPRDYMGQKVLILGKGNSAFETADSILPATSLLHLCSPHSLKLAYRTHYAGHLRAVNSSFLDAYQLQERNALLDASVKRIRRLENGKLAVSFDDSSAGKKSDEPLLYDRVIACTGFRFDASMFAPSCRPKLVYGERLPEQSSEWESTQASGLYFAGSLMQMRDYKRKQSGFLHGFRYNVKLLHQLFEQRYHGVELPWAPIDDSPEGIARRLLERVRSCSSLWRQAGYMCDLVLACDVGADEAALAEYAQQLKLPLAEAARRLSRPRHYHDLTLDLVHDLWFGACERYYTLTLEYGPAEGEEETLPLRGFDAARPAGLHPVVRRFSRGELLREHHIDDDLEGLWRDARFIQTLAAFFVAESPTPRPRALTPA